MTKLITISLHL